MGKEGAIIVLPRLLANYAMLLVFWAHCRTAAMVGTQLGFNHLPPIQWQEQGDILWDQLVPVLFEALKSRSLPDFMVLNLGENDLVACSTTQLLDNLARDIGKISCLMPGTRLV